MPQVTVLHNERKKRVLKMALLASAVGVVAIIVLVIAINLVWAGQHSEALKNAQTLDGKKDYASEVEYLQRYVNTNPPRQYKYDALVAEGKAAEKESQYRTAFVAYLSADTSSSKPNLDLKLDVARAATAIGDKATAVSYYKQAIGMTPTNDTNDIFMYQDQIRGLGGTP